MVELMRVEVAEKKNPPALSKVRFEAYREGPSAQILHNSPYSAEEPTIAKLHEHVRQSGRSLRGKHHEIFLKNVRKTAPEKLPTILRQPYA